MQQALDWVYSAELIDAHKVDSLAIYYASLVDGKEGVAAFREKRAAAFKSKASQMPDFYPWW